MGLLKKLKAAGGGLKDVGGEVSAYASRLKTNVEKEISTPGTSGQRFADAPLGLTYMLPKPVQKVAGFVAPTPRKTVRDTAAFASRPGVGTGLALGSDVASIAALPALVAGPLKGVKAAGSATTTLRTRAPLAFPDAAPERSLAGRIKNVMNNKIATDRAAAAFTARREAELPGKISAVKSEIARIDNMPTRSAQARAGDKNISLINRIKGEEGALRFPAGSPKKIQQAHANVPKGQLLFTAEADVTGGGNVQMAFTKKASIGQSAERSAAMDRSVEDVTSGRAKLSGFYEKIKDESGWVRASAQDQGKTSVLKFGKGKFPGEANIGEGALKAGYYEAHLTGSRTPGAVKVSWLTKRGNVDLSDLKSEVKAIGLGLKARGVSAIEHEPLESGRHGSASRSRLFARVLKGSGFKNIDRGAPDIKRRLDAVRRWT